jgi:hypothetical protein
MKLKISSVVVGGRWSVVGLTWATGYCVGGLK